MSAQGNTIVANAIPALLILPGYFYIFFLAQETGSKAREEIGVENMGGYFFSPTQ
jgi:hypothetical protein